MARKTDDRPVDVGLAALRGKEESALVQWWKERYGMIAAIPVDTARVGALTPQLRELARIGDAAERRKLTRARLVAFTELPSEQRQLIAAARRVAWNIDPRLLEEDQKVIDELLPQLDPSLRETHTRPQ
jgi:hypothetical protein